jgi:serine/threonine protein kinase/formylglycine-generating enzyme required for sulfatase activity
MPPAAVADFLAAARRYAILDEGQLADLERMAQVADVRGLMRVLVLRGWLTPFQANQLALGRGCDLLLGSYAILEKLGEGGMGAVFKARHVRLGRVVALKVIRKDRLESEIAVRRFRREIEAIATLDHPNVLRAFDADESGGKHFLVMEYVEGADLAKVLRRRGPLPVAEACDYVRQAALGLQHASEKGLVHRDVKPANLLLTAADLVKVTDLGLARLSRPGPDGVESSTLTREGSVMGSLDYMAPEQAIDSHAVDTRADLYSLGCTLYHLLTGRVPFPGGEALGKLLRHRLEEPEPVERLRPEVTPAVASAVRRLMAKSPGERYQAPTELAQAIEDILRGRAEVRTVSLAGAATRPGPEVDPFASLGGPATPVVPKPSPGRGRLTLAVAASGLLLAVLALGGWLLSRPGKVENVTSGTTSRGPGTEEPPPGVSAGQVQAARALGVPVRVTNCLGMQLNLIPAGKFLMGRAPNEPAGQTPGGPQRQASIAAAFYMGVHEVTQGDYVRVMSTHPSAPQGADGAGPRHPVTAVSCEDAVAFCAALGALLEEQKASRRYRLPREDEWEYACRAGTQTTYYFGDDRSLLPRYEWISPQLMDFKTKPVGSLLPNPFGLFDMCGNVAEWSTRKPDGEVGVARGGPIYGAPDVGCSIRYEYGYRDRYKTIGFRVVCEFPQQQP